jgi:Myb/SANT-like DNA-binding domain
VVNYYDSLNEKFEVKLNTKQMKECFNNLKKEYQLVKELRNLSGFGWNSETQMVTAKADVWDAYLVEHKDAKRFRGKIWPFWDAIHQLLDGRIPTGNEKLYPTMNGIPSAVIY